MDPIQAIVKSFSLEEHKDFRQFIQRKKQKGKRKDLQLYDFFYEANQPEKSEILAHLYDSESAAAKNAYHTIRKRLQKEINDFLYLKRVEQDLSKTAEVHKSLILVQHLLEHRLFKLAWKHLNKAEKIALESEYNQELVLIYNLQIQYYSPAFATKSVNEIVANRIKANALYQEDENLKIIGSLVKQELERIIKEGEDIDLQRLTDQLIRQFELENALFNRPKLLFNFVFLTRTVFLGKKDYKSIEGFLLNSFKKLKRTEYLEKNKADYLKILYACSHTLYRNKKFSEAIQYLEEMESVLDEVTKGIYKEYFPKYLLLYSACENFRGQLDFSIELLEQTLEIDYLQKVDFLNGTLNLAVYYFEKENFKKANQVLMNIGHTDNWLEKNMGVEWRLKKHIIESIFQFELGNPDLSFDRITSIERAFPALLKTSKYQKVTVFLALLKKVVNNPTIAQSNDFLKQVEGSFDWVGAANEDLQEMSYYAWLKSKMQGKKFYEVLLELMQLDDS
ncbi:MAG: hypothetical protein ABJG68_03230 [Crocinitomicaceae bacterium]